MEYTSRKQFVITEDIYATQGQRISNYLIDLVIQYIIAILLGVLAVLISELLGMYSFVDWIENMGRIEGYLLGFFILVIYYGTFEILLSRTIGKFITKTIVVLEDGSKPDAGTILKRTFCRLIPFEQFSFLGGYSRGWHDSISDTYVVNKAALEEEKRLFYDFEEIGSTPVEV